MRISRNGWVLVGLFAWICSAWGATPQVGGGEGYTCALGASGRAFCWGSNAAGQMGDVTSVSPANSQFGPVEMAGGFVAVSSGGRHACGLQAGGAVFCWGDNNVGQLGTGSTNAGGVSLPVRVVTTASFTVISAGGVHTCALEAGGKAWCWGSNESSQLGNIGTPNVFSATPVPVTPVTMRFKSISAGAEHTCAIDMNDDAWCWGSNLGARAGIDVNNCGQSESISCAFNYAVKTQASGPRAGVSHLPIKFKSLSAGAVNTCGIDLAGNVQCWGTRLRGQTLTGSPDQPAQVPMIAGAVSISAGGSANYADDHSVCAVAGNGELFCWGDGDQGQLGNGGTPLVPSISPVNVSGTQDYVSVSVGIAQACARTAIGVLRCWGANGHGELGVAGTSSRAVPTTVPGLGSAQIAVGGDHACSLDAVGVTACWGDNTWGQVGHGGPGYIPLQSVVPTPVARFFNRAVGRPPIRPERFIPTIPEKGGAAAFSRLAVGGQHSCVLNAEGVAYCWGADGNGQIGNGNRTSVACRFGPGSPNTCVPAPTIVSRAARDIFNDISAGVTHTCAINQQSQVRCWGSAGSGELGPVVRCAGPGRGGALPCFRRSPAPTVSAAMAAVAAGDKSTCAVSGLGLVCWGSIVAGSPRGVQPRLGTLTRVGTGSAFACAGQTNGAASCFGDNSSGQLGDTNNTSSPTLRPVSHGAFSTLALNGSFACAVDAGDVWCWGANRSGQLGNGTANNSNVPIQVLLGANFGAVGVGVGASHACAINQSGAINCWGSNANGELGNGVTATAPQTAPVAVAGGWSIP
jgi:alpha-tubulin suppressor-like RCC1 family protein